MQSMKTFIFGAVATACVATSPAVLASLGGDVASVESDRVQMKAAAVRTSQSALYTVHQIQTPSGTTVREFANAAGTVFAVTWKGPFMPDLRQTLGTYFQTYQTAPRAKRYGHSRDILELPGLVVHSTGRMRAFRGNAYVPQLVPAGVSIDQLDAQSFQ
jgi:hypothetical protein